MLFTCAQKTSVSLALLIWSWSRPHSKREADSCCRGGAKRLNRATQRQNRRKRKQFFSKMTNENSPDQPKQAVESQHGGKATFVQDVPMQEEHNEQTAWDGVVSVLTLRAVLVALSGSMHGLTSARR